MPVQIIKPSGVLAIGDFGPNGSDPFDTNQEAADNLADLDTDTLVVNQSTNQTIKLALADLNSDNISTISQLQVKVGVYAGGKGGAGFSVLLETADGGDIAAAEGFLTTATAEATELTGTAITGLNSTEALINGMTVSIVSDGSRQCFFTSLAVFCTYSQSTIVVSDTGKIIIDNGRIELTSGKVIL